LVDLYVYDYEYDKKGPEVIYFCEILRKLSDLYDFIIVNADESSVLGTPYIYKTASKVFIVHDFMPTKIRATKKLLLKMISAGIDTQKTVSLIYNKTLSDTIDIGKVEEKLLFIRLPNKKIIPTVDLNCNTFEIPYEQKTMAAIIRNLATNSTGIESTTKKYKNNILNIYKCINDIPYTDNEEMEISLFVKEKLQRLTDPKYITVGLNNIKTDIVSLKDSKIAIKLRNSKLLTLEAKDLRLKLIKRYDSIRSTIVKSKYFRVNNKKQH
jgi:hypothetical protein